MFFFFFKQKTAYEMRISDWSSDVCSSDLGSLVASPARKGRLAPRLGRRSHHPPSPAISADAANPARCARRHREMRKTMYPRLLMLAIAPVLLAASEPGEADPMAGAQTVSDEGLAAQRGGFAVQGMVTAFGADIRS